MSRIIVAVFARQLKFIAIQVHAPNVPMFGRDFVSEYAFAAVRINGVRVHVFDNVQQFAVLFGEVFLVNDLIVQQRDSRYVVGIQ